MTNGTTYNATESYNVIYASPTTYKVNVTYSLTGENLTTTAWILKNGTPVAIDEAGTNLTGSLASTMLVGLFAGFTTEAESTLQLPTYTSPAYFKATGPATTVTIGTVPFIVTTYAANNLPETVMPCGDSGTLNLTTYTLTVGAPAASTVKLVTAMHLAGTETTNGQTSPVNYEILLISATVG